MRLVKLRTQDQDLNRVQDNVSAAFDILSGSTLLGGNIVEVTLGTGVTEVSHFLPQRFTGWIVVRKNANENVWEGPQITPRATVALQASGTVTLSLYIF